MGFLKGIGGELGRLRAGLLVGVFLVGAGLYWLASRAVLSRPNPKSPVPMNSILQSSTARSSGVPNPTLASTNSLPPALRQLPREEQPTARLISFVNSEAQKVSDFDTDLARSGQTKEEELEKFAKSLSPLELKGLAKWTIDHEADGNERMVAVYLLSKAGAQALPHLKEVAQSPLPELKGAGDPHSAAAVLHETEVSLRLSALEAIDTSEANDASVKAALQDIVKNQRENDLQWLANLALAGRESGRKGKLKRFMDEIMKNGGA